MADQEMAQTSDNDGNATSHVTYEFPTEDLTEIIFAAVGQTVATMLNRTRNLGPQQR